MYRLLLIFLIIGIFGWLIYGKQANRHDMKLVNQKTGFVLVEFHAAQTQIHDPFLSQEMEKRGITIPPFLRKSFQGAKRIRLGDRDFQKAFKEVYYELNLDHATYQWRMED